jgi:hypothetical protein
MENLQIFVALYGIPTNYDRASAHYSYLGRFFVNPTARDVAKATLVYDLSVDTLRVHLRVPVEDKDLAESGVYSLADITPGAISAFPTVRDDRLCGEPYVKATCDPLIDGLQNTGIDEFQLSFAFPKKISISGQTGPGLVRCVTKQKRVSISLPDIDLIDSLGNIRRTDAPPLPEAPCVNQRFDQPIVLNIRR